MMTASPPSLKEASTVAHVTGCYVYGSENWIHAQVKHLRAHAPFVLTGRTKNHDQLDWTPPCYKTFGRVLPIRALDRVGKGVLGYRPSKRWHIHRHNASLIHAHFGPKGYEALPLVAATGLPLITTFYGYDLSKLPRTNPAWRNRYRMLFERGTRFLVEGGHMADCLVDLGCPREKVEVQHLGIEIDKFPFEPERRSEVEPLRVLAAGRFVEKKGFPDAIQAFAQFLETGGEGYLTIVGGRRSKTKNRKAREVLREIVRRHGIEEYTELRGFLAHEEIIKEYCRHDVFLSPSVEASDGDNEGGAPVTLIEASATGSPVISTWHCDIPEVVRHEKTGLLAEEGDTEKLASHLLEVYQNPDWAEALGEAARDHIEAEYNAKTQGERLDTIYKSIV
ncbi:glycosyltransferase [Salinibacter altiplanensis]|uniref:glycosyltransferase n=1 Tax=Salinibacter altiplanensis TaxID=1803181 RepID=UPI000C9F61FE|nr:glycosyltransferase [Salinibacter altiplanensis]